MKKLFLILPTLMLLGAFAFADSPKASMTYVKRAHSHHKVQHHHANKAGKHHARRSRNTV